MNVHEAEILKNATKNEDGEYFLTKRFYFVLEASDFVTVGGVRRIKDTSPLALRNAIGFPQIGVALTEDGQYVMTGVANVGLTAELANIEDPKNAAGTGSRYAYVDATYKFAGTTGLNRDLNGDPITDNTPPWNLPAQNFTLTFPENRVAFEFAYTAKGERKVRLQNLAQSQIIADTFENIAEFSFTYYVRKFNGVVGLELQNSVNLNALTMAGLNFPEESLRLKNIDVQSMKTYTNSGQVKWEYDAIRVIIQFNLNGWKRKFLNVGTEAIFPPGTRPEPIYIWRENQESETLGNVKYTSAADAMKEEKRLKDLDKNFIATPATEPLPLTTAGLVDTAAIDTPYNQEGVTNYVSIEAREFPPKNWNALNLPKKR